VNRLSLTLGIAAMDTCWIAPWAMLVGAWIDQSRPRPLLSALSVLGLVVLGAWTTQLLGRRAASNRAVRLTIVGLGVLATLIAVRIEHYPGSGAVDWLAPLARSLALVIGEPGGPALAAALGLLVWWRGVRLGSQSPTHPDVENAFRWGMGLLISFALVLSVTMRPSRLHFLEAQTMPFVVGFFFVGLLSLALGRLESLRTRTRTLGVNGQWLGTLVLVSGLIILVALLIGQLMSFDVLIDASRPLFDLLGLIVLVLIYVIVIPLAYVMEWVLYALLSLLRDNPNQQPPLPRQPSDIDTLLQRVFSEGLPAELLLGIRAAAAVALLAIALIVIARTISRWRPASSDADGTQEERDSLWEPGRLRAALVAWLRRLLGRSTRPLVAASAAAGSLEPRGLVTVSSVREQYRELLRLGDAAGAHRAEATTPLEHLPALQDSLEPEGEIAALTAAYLEARYAEHEPAVDVQLAVIRARGFLTDSEHDR
jgi:hypothetical protein